MLSSRKIEQSNNTIWKEVFYMTGHGTIHCDFDLKEYRGQAVIGLSNKDIGSDICIEVDQPVSIINSRMVDVANHRGATAFFTSGNRDIDITYHGANTWTLFDELNIYEFQKKV